MDYDEVKQKFLDALAFQGMDDVARALLFWKAQELNVPPGSIVFSQGDALDDSFYLVLAGDFNAEANGQTVGTIPAGQIFGEMAFVSPVGTRMATVRAGSAPGSLLRFQLSQEELAAPALRPLKEHFRSEAWMRIVSNAQAST